MAASICNFTMTLLLYFTFYTSTLHLPLIEITRETNLFFVSFYFQSKKSREYLSVEKIKYRSNIIAISIPFTFASKQPQSNLQYFLESKNLYSGKGKSVTIKNFIITTQCNYNKKLKSQLTRLTQRGDLRTQNELVTTKYAI